MFYCRRLFARPYHSFRRPMQKEKPDLRAKYGEKPNLLDKNNNNNVNGLYSETVANKPARIKRTFKDLWKPATFAIGSSGICYVYVVINDYTRIQQWKEYFFDSKNWGYEPDPKKKISVKEAIQNGWMKNDLTARILGILIKINLVSFTIYLCWRLAPTQKFMIRHFVCDFFAKKLSAFAMISSPFSHLTFPRLFFYMSLFTMVGFPVAAIQGPEQFRGFCFSAAVFSSLAGLTLSAITGKSLYGRPSGAGGPLFALMVYFFARHKTAKVKLAHLPQFSISTENLVLSILFFQMSFVILSLPYSHPFFIMNGAHLGGSVFGLWYCLHGEKLLWRKYRPLIIKKWVALTERKR